jgi:hypothetical protein
VIAGDDGRIPLPPPTPARIGDRRIGDHLGDGVALAVSLDNAHMGNVNKADYPINQFIAKVAAASIWVPAAPAVVLDGNRVFTIDGEPGGSVPGFLGAP